jgi:hypothetical protein
MISIPAGVRAHLRVTGLLPLIGILACHSKTVHGPDKVPPAQLNDERSRSASMSDDGVKIESLERTVLRVGDSEMPLTLDDAKGIQAALLDYLRQSDYEFRDALMGWTKGFTRIDAEGKVRIGPWLLGADEDVICLRFMEPPGAHSALAHWASLTKKDGAWTVTKLLTERVRLRR